MGTVDTSVIEKRVHRNFPEAREFWLAPTSTRDAETIIGHAVVQCVGPIRVSVRFCDGNGRHSARVIRELCLGEELQGVHRVVEERRSETPDFGERDPSEGVEGDQVAVYFFGGRSTDMGHTVVESEHRVSMSCY